MEKAMEYYNKSLKIAEEIEDKGGIAQALNNIGVLFFNKLDNNRALEFYEKSFKLREEIADKEGIANSLGNIGRVYLLQKNYPKALEFGERSMKLSRELGFPENIKNTAMHFYNVYNATGNYKLAFENYELYIQMRDSIVNEATKKASIKNQLKYEYEKRAAADSVKNVEAQKVKDAQLHAQAASLKQEKTQRYALYGGLVLVAGFLIFVINRFRITNKQKKIIEEQKVVVDQAFEKLHEKNKEVLDSIRYAKRIQVALLSNEKYIERVLRKLNQKV
jgi:tetratricopeptide (TPR) repeat protein